MAITINWATRVINVPKADMPLIQATPTEIRELPLDDFRMELKGLEEGEIGMLFPDTHSHNPPVSVGGVTLARVVELINDYTVTFEDGQYAVNLTGANSNVSDKANVNQVSVRSSNSAGMIMVETGVSGLTQDESAALLALEVAVGTLGLDVARSLGLAQENYKLDQTVHDVNGNLTSGRIQIFTDATMTTVMASYNITAVFAAGLLTSYQVVKQ